MIENAVFLKGENAELLSRVLSEVKTKHYEESQTSLDDSQALEINRRFSFWHPANPALGINSEGVLQKN